MTDTMEKIDTNPVIQDPGEYGNMVAHIIRKKDQMRGYVMGEEIEALCGYKWAPARDYEGLPVCQACKDVLAKIKGG